MMDSFSILHEYRLVELDESKIHGAWKGGHLLLFFLSFVFGSFCTFCFHMLAYIFDDKCVLFPKVIHVTHVREQNVSDIFPVKNLPDDSSPVDFLSTIWVDKKTCYLPMYVPLVSGLLGLVWTTMFLMCTSGRGTMAGLRQPWRIIPFVFLFSVAMSGVCIYASVLTHTGLNELCNKLAEATGSSGYTINVATLIYERRVRGIYQATMLTIVLSWLHTMCWVFSALLAVVRILVAADFQLIKVNVQVVGNIEKMLEKHEEYINSVFPDPHYEIALAQYEFANAQQQSSKKASTNPDAVNDIFMNRQLRLSESSTISVSTPKTKKKQTKLAGLVQSITELGSSKAIKRRKGRIDLRSSDDVTRTRKLSKGKKNPKVILKVTSDLPVDIAKAHVHAEDQNTINFADEMTKIVKATTAKDAVTQSDEQDITDSISTSAQVEDQNGKNVQGKNIKKVNKTTQTRKKTKKD